MVKCLACDGESPDGSLHCVHCGTKIGGAGARTAFGLPAVRPQGGRISDKGTMQLDSNVEALATPMPLSDAPAEPAPSQSLLAGLPRPRVSSAPSPLTEGLKRRESVRRAQPSARSTVMGMPIFSAPVPERPSTGAPATPNSAGAQVGSLDSVANEQPSGAVIQNLDSFGRVSNTPPGGDKSGPTSLEAEPTPLANPPEHPAPVAAGSGLADTPEPSGVSDTPAPAALRGEPKADPRPVAAPTPAPSPTPAADEDLSAESSTGSRALAAVVGLTLLVLFAYPIGKDWFFNAIGKYEGFPQIAFGGIGGMGALVLLLALVKMPNRTRALLTVVFGAVGLACLAAV